MDVAFTPPERVIRPLRTVVEQTLLATAFGFFAYIILFFVSVSTVLPAVSDSGVAGVVFWSVTVSVLFAVQIACAYVMLKPIKDLAVRSGFLSGAAIVLGILAASPLLLSEESVRADVFGFSLLLVAPLLGNIIGGWIVSRRS